MAKTVINRRTVVETHPPEIQRIADRWTGENCTLVILDQEFPSKIIGRQLKFALVAPLNSYVPPVEFTWEAVDRIMAGDKRFMS
jgi:hypothetical protein